MRWMNAADRLGLTWAAATTLGGAFTMQIVLYLTVYMAMSMRAPAAPTTGLVDMVWFAELAGTMAVAGAGGSAVVSAAQAWVVRSRIPPVWFFVATVAGWGIAFGSYMPVSGAMYAAWKAWGIGAAGRGPIMSDFAGWSTQFATSGALLGIAQWWLLRRWVRHAWIWIAASLVGGVMAYAVYVLAHFLLVMLVYRPGSGFAFPPASSILLRQSLMAWGIAACCCLGYGAITGAALSWLTKYGRPAKAS